MALCQGRAEAWGRVADALVQGTISARMRCDSRSRIDRDWPKQPDGKWSWSISGPRSRKHFASPLGRQVYGTTWMATEFDQMHDVSVGRGRAALTTEERK